MAPDTFTLVIRGEPGHAAPTIIRLRQFLKHAHRAWGLRCVEIRRTQNVNANPKVQ
jgi:hypothetical protein